MLKIERVGSCAVWTIDRPAAKNALNLETIDLILLAAEEAANDRELRAVVLTGSGDAFASGGDLRELRTTTTREDADRFAAIGTEMCDRIALLPFPVIAALPGPAFGGGAELAVACDLRIADVRARVSFKQARMGVTTGLGGLARLASLVGRGIAARLLYTSYEMGAAEAKLCGLVDEVVPNGACVELALAWALDVAQGSPTAVAHLKALVRAAYDAPATLPAEERRRFLDTWVSADHEEAMNAYFARRAPKWGPRT